MATFGWGPEHGKKRRQEIRDYTTERDTLLTKRTLDVQRLANVGRMDVQGLANIGQMNIQGSSNVAAMARERLGQEGQTARAGLNIAGRADVAGRDIAGRMDVTDIQQTGQTERARIVTAPDLLRARTFETGTLAKPSISIFDEKTGTIRRLGSGLGPPPDLGAVGIFNWIRTSQDRGQVDLYMKDLEINDPTAFAEIQAMWRARKRKGRAAVKSRKSKGAVDLLYPVSGSRKRQITMGPLPKQSPQNVVRNFPPGISVNPRRAGLFGIGR